MNDDDAREKYDRRSEETRTIKRIDADGTVHTDLWSYGGKAARALLGAGAPLYSVTARFRYRIGGDRSLKLGYVLERPQLILDLAFEDVVALLRTGRGETDTEREVIAVRAPIYLGRP